MKYNRDYYLWGLYWKATQTEAEERSQPKPSELVLQACATVKRVINQELGDHDER